MEQGQRWRCSLQKLSEASNLLLEIEIAEHGKLDVGLRLKFHCLVAPRPAEAATSQVLTSPALNSLNLHKNNLDMSFGTGTIHGRLEASSLPEAHLQTGANSAGGHMPLVSRCSSTTVRPSSLKALSSDSSPPCAGMISTRPMLGLICGGGVEPAQQDTPAPMTQAEAAARTARLPLKM